MTDELKALSEERCAHCGELLNVQPGGSFVASVNGKVWHNGCAPSNRLSPEAISLPQGVEKALAAMRMAFGVPDVSEEVKQDALDRRDRAIAALASPPAGLQDRGASSTLVSPTIKGLLGEIVRIARDYDLRERIDEHDDGIADSFIWRDCIDAAEAVLAQPQVPAPVGEDGLVARAEVAIQLITDGNFYSDYDQATAALGDLRAAIEALSRKKPLRIEPAPPIVFGDEQP